MASFDTQPSGQEPAEESIKPVGATSKLRRLENGQIDLLHAVGGVRGIIEALLPGFLFLSVFLLTKTLLTALLAAGAVALVFALLRLVQKGSLLQSASGIIGLAICAFAALRSGEAAEFYLPGLWINAVYALALLAALLFRVPVLGFVYALVRGEEKTWRADPQRVRAYSLATLIVLLMFVLRLVVQVPLYLAENVTALGTARLLMGTPLYAAVLWASWMVSRPLSESAR